MINRFRRSLAAEDGFSLVEVTVAMILSSMIAASLVTVFYSFSQNSGDLAAKSNVQSAVRAVISQQVVALRQALRADLNGDAVEALSSNRLVFYTQNYATSQIERVVYERRECVEGECELWVYKYALESTDGIVTIFATTPYDSSFLMGKVLSDQPLFVGIEYIGDPLTKTETSFCDGGSVACDFPVVGITLRARPNPASGGATSPVEIRDEVRIRSV